MTTQQERARSGFSPAALSCLAFFALAAAYSTYVHIQSANLFYEAQFLHYEFLKELLARHVTPRGFFTTFGEHMFPGYNLILAANVILFRIWGGFDNAVYAVFLIVGAALVAQRVYEDADWHPVLRVAGLTLILLLLLSTVHNPMWGMALAAAGGVCLFVICARILTTALWANGPLRWFFVLFPIAQLLFLGGYSIGALGSIGLLLLVRAVQDRRLTSPLWKIAVTIAVTVVVYVALTSHFSDMTANVPAAGAKSFEAMFRFFFVMMGASVLGKALFEQGISLLPYYVCGAVLALASIGVWMHALRKRNAASMFVLALSAYSLVNILAVALFRYRNGIDGAMGQWYAVHTQFVPVAIVWWLFDVTRWKLPALGLATVIAFASALAYQADWKKGEFVPDYKNGFIAQAPVILAFPETIKDRNDPTQTMMWYWRQVKPTIDLMYQHRLWIFKASGPVVSGLTYDNWIELEKPVTLLCPSGTHSASFRLWRKDEWPSASVDVRAGGKVIEENANSQISVEFNSGPAVLMIDARDAARSKPQTAAPDTRKLVAIASQFQCH
ncbi:hypothetical protein [Paraburkholderia heleia]|uniref:hypothetical protein n=1 Tax=Paraburkholderia heleia TaxID=634127 RepID=UPI0005A9AC27|nr:hypothetical protein [Paraburkholderia heleia]